MGICSVPSHCSNEGLRRLLDFVTVPVWVLWNPLSDDYQEKELLDTQRLQCEANLFMSNHQHMLPQPSNLLHSYYEGMLRG